MIRSIEWNDDAVRIIDQTQLPEKLVYIDLGTPEEVWEAIRKLRVRGAPAIGIAGAMGLSLGVARKKYRNKEEILREVKRIASYLESVRPTAYNLFWAIQRVKARALASAEEGVEDIKRVVREETEAILREEEEMSRRMGENALRYIPDGSVVLTHCNTGVLATGGIGTALAGIYLANEAGRNVKVYACETRPLLQGARLTAWELMREGIDVTLITDGMAAHVMRERGVDLVMLGADRIARNGDAANKIGTYQHALSAKAHGIPFYVVAPISTVDPGTSTGREIKIEERDPEEVFLVRGRRIAPEGVKVYNPAFDVTPARLITAIITDRGVVESPSEENMRRILDLEKREGELEGRKARKGASGGSKKPLSGRASKY